MSRARLLPTAIILILGTWLFAQALFGDGLFAFRDAADFYYPLFQLVQREWHAGRAPLWNPYDNLGIPLAANPTASVWYPAKAVFFLPISFQWAYRVYVIGHVFLAAAAAFRLARHWRAGPQSATIAALSYAFCGPVLYQYANVVFLVGAAWLPLAIAAADVMFRRSSWRYAMLFGAILAMMILGGEPQTAYHALFLAALYWLMVVRVEHPPADPTGLNLWRTWIGAMGLFTVAAATLFLLAAVQILPSKEFADRSDRAVRYNARSVWEIPQVLAHDDAGKRIRDGLLCDMSDDGHLEQVYRFSIEPHRFAEMIWPNCGGRQFPIHRRWFDELSEENYIWTPSLYLGLLPLLLAWSQFRLLRGPATQRWLSWMFLLAVAASLGTFGVGWILRHFGVECSEPVGGVYWLLTVLLPGYLQFRYPAKWMTVAALAVAMLAARGWQAIEERGDTVRLRRSCWAMAAISLLGFLAAWIVRPWWSGWLADAAPNSMFGPLDVAGAHCDLLWSLGQTTVMAMAVLWLVRSGGTAGLSSSVLCVRWSGWMAALLLAVDLAVANGWTVVCAPAQLWREPSALADYIRADASRRDPSATSGRPALSLSGPPRFGERPAVDPPVRIDRRWIWQPEAWRKSSSSDRLAEAVRWHRDTLAPQHHQSFGIAAINTYGTLMLADFEYLLRGPPLRSWVDALGPEAQRRRSWIPVAQYEISPALRPSVEPDDVSIERVKESRLRAWVVHETEAHPVLSLCHEAGPRSWQTIFFNESLETAGYRKALVEGRELPESTTPAEPEPCRIMHYDPQCVRIEAELKSPGLVILSDQFYPGWELQVASDGREPQAVEILRTNLVMRGAWLPAGKHVLEYRYRPRSFLVGASLSGVGWGLGLIGLAVGAWRKRRKRPTQHPAG